MVFKVPSTMYQNAGVAGAVNSLSNAMFDNSDITGLDPSQIYAQEQLARQRKATAAQQELETGQWQNRIGRGNNFSPTMFGSTFLNEQQGLSHILGRDMMTQGTQWGGDPVSAGATDGTAISNAMTDQPITSEADLQRAYALMNRTMPGKAFSPDRRSAIFEAMEQGDLDQQGMVNATNLEKQRLSDIAAGGRQDTVNLTNLEQQRLSDIAAGGRQDTVNLTNIDKQKLIESGEITQADMSGVNTLAKQRLVDAGDLAQQGTVNLTNEYMGQDILSPEASEQLVPGYAGMSDEDLLKKGFQRLGQGLRPTGSGKNKTYISTYSDDIQRRNITNSTLSTYYDEDGGASEGYEGFENIPGNVFDYLAPQIKAMVQDNTEKHFGDTPNATREVVANLMNDGVTIIKENDDMWGGDDVAMPTILYNRLQSVYDEMKNRQQEAQGLQMIAASMRSRGYSDSDIKSAENWFKGETSR